MTASPKNEDPELITRGGLAELIRRRREQLGLSQEGLAEYVDGLDHATLSNWELGRYLARHLVLLHTLSVLGIDLVRRDVRFLETRTQEAESTK